MSEILVYCTDCRKFVKEKYAYHNPNEGGDICYKCIRKRNQQYEQREKVSLLKWL